MTDIHVICGPTASGKSARALELAAERNGVIINADSLQIFDALPILTAQPDTVEQAQAPHRLYGTLDPAAGKISAAQWGEMSTHEIRSAVREGRTPLIVGGTGFYLKALMEGLSPIPDIPDSTRKTYMDMQTEAGTDTLYALLKERDPEISAKLKPTDTQRIIRALEVFEATGKSLLYWQSLPKQPPSADWQFHVEKIIPERDVLHRQIETRFHKMIALGAIEEVADLVAKIDEGQVPEDAAITHALGFEPLRDHLGGKLSLEAAIDLGIIETRQYAKRQVTWFRHQL